MEPLAERGDEFAQYIVGLQYENIREYEIAFNWVLKSAEQGHIYAQAAVDYMYSEGRGCERNIEKSIFWNTKKSNFWLIFDKKHFSLHNG